MEVTQIPFVKKLEITQDQSQLHLKPKDDLLNHINTLHAGALFTLAEAASGLLLQDEFPTYSKNSLPILRTSNIKYIKSVTGEVKTKASLQEGAKEKFINTYEKKGRGLLEVFVELFDQENVLCAKCSFTWFVQKFSFLSYLGNVQALE